MNAHISAQISAETKAQLDTYLQRRGGTKARLVEDALLHHLAALRELPEDVLIPPRLVLTPAGLNELARRLEADEPPTQALRELMDGRDA